MVIASFFGKAAEYTGFEIKGHAGYDVAGQDIVCAAISAMTMLAINTVETGFGVPSSLDVDEDSGTIRFSVKEKRAAALTVLSSFRNELLALSAEYPQNILVKE